MSLIDRLIEPTKNYISFRDFIFHLSSINNEPLYEVVTYLLHHDLNSLGFYNIDADYKIIHFNQYEFDSIKEFLEDIQKALAFSANEWVFSSSESLGILNEADRRLLTTTVMKAMHSYFKKSELLGFKPLDGLLHFDPENIADENSSSVSVEQLLEDALEKIDRLEQSQADGSFAMGTPEVAHGEDKTYEQLVEALAAANAEIRQHKQTINRLSDQVDKSTEDKLLPYNSQISVAKMLYAILTEHNYDLSATKGKANSLIEKASQLHGTSVTRNFIAQWIELANQAKNDSTK